MDKNAIIGFVLIGLLLVGYSWLSRPSEAQMEAQRRYQDSIAAVTAQQNTLVQEPTAAADSGAVVTTTNEAYVQQGLTDSAKQVQLSNNFGVFANATIGEEKFLTLENENIEVKVNTKGGRISYARVKEYVTYDKEPLVLFDNEDSEFNLTFVTATNRVIKTSDLYFKTLESSANKVVMRLNVGESGIVDFEYTLKPDDYMVDFTVRTSGLNGILAPSTNSLDIQWNQKMRTMEKGRKLENQYTGLYYKYLTDDVEHIGEASDDSKQISNRLKWIGYKSKYFTAAFIANNYLAATTISTKQEESDSGYLKDFYTTTAVPFNQTGNENIGFRFFFGPNKFKLLKSYDKGLSSGEQLDMDNLVPMGYKWVRPINEYFILPIFNFLNKFFSNYGLIIFLLTLIIKMVLFPLTYKSYLSQAKMRVLKPQVDKLKEKFPKKEQAMELQQATMALYSSAGASPLSGCLPMLLQMPILIALYWLFPTAIELRQQGFLWAEDLSTYDAVISWNFDIPLISTFLGNHLSLFCLLMTVVNVVYTKINMNMTNTGQQQMPGMNMMLYIMPVMFFFMFNQSSAGLSYYFLISTLITIAQTVAFRFGINEEKLLAKLEANKKKPKKKSGFMARLEEAQRVQKEQMRKQQQLRDKQQRSSKR